MSAKRVLIVPMRWPLAERLRADGHEVVEADTVDDAVERAGAGIDAVLLDARMPNEMALDVLAGLRDRDPDPPIILLAGREDAAMVTTALAGGAFDYAYEPIDPDDIARRMVRAFEITRLRRELRTLRDRLARPFTVSSLLGASAAMDRVRELTRKVATSADKPVLLVGARGTGRDHVARVIHYSGGRAQRPFLKKRCAARDEDALAAELFGREPLPGPDVATHARGVFDEAHEGTLCLDDVDQLPLTLQRRLLRYLESRDFRRVGGGTDIRVDVRIIATSRRPLGPLVERGEFPPDLFYRLNVLGFELAPLASHPEDVAILARHFVEQRLDPAGGSPAILPDAEAALTVYSWPGNVDELRAVMDRAVILAAGQPIGPEHLGDLGRAHASRSTALPFELPDAGCDLDDVERSLVMQALDRCGGNQTRAATLLGVHRDQIRYRLGKYKKDDANR